MPDLRRVLIIEDSPTMRSLYRMVLGSGTGEILFAEDGVQGLDQAARQPDVDLYVVDINLPRMDGLEFIRRLRAELGVTETPVIVVSTECRDADREAAVEAGADAYLCKPWKPDELLEVLDRLREEDA